MKPAQLFAVLLLLAPAVSAETIYKYRRADGQMIYSNRPVAGVELIESFEYTFPPAAVSVGTGKKDAEADARIKLYLSALDAAWKRVQDSTRALVQAEERLKEGTEPLDGERQGVVADAAPAAGVGVPAAASPAIGGSLSGRRGRASPEYEARMRTLEANVASARARLDDALRSYNQLR